MAFKGILDHLASKGLGDELTEKVHRDYRAFLRTGDLSGLSALKILTGVEMSPLEETIQDKYLTYVRCGMLYQLKHLMEISGIQPKVKDVAIEKLKTYIRQGAGHHLLKLKEFKEILGIELPEDNIQEKYGDYIHSGRVSSLNLLEKLMLITGFELNLSEEAIQREYKLYIKRGKLENLDRLKEISCVSPSEDIVQEAYGRYINKIQIGNLRKLMKITGLEVKPSATSGIQKVYKTCFANGRIEELKSLNEITGIMPILSEKIAQKLYKMCMKKCHSFLKSWEALKEFTGISPSEATVQSAYQMLIQDNNRLGGLSELKRITMISPSEEIIQEGYIFYSKNYSKNRQLKNLVNLMEITQVEPSKETCDAIANNFFYIKHSS